MHRAGSWGRRASPARGAAAPRRWSAAWPRSGLRRAVWEGQLRHLLKCAELHNLQLQIMPNSRETNAGVDGPMVLLETPDHRTIGYVEGQRGSYFLTDPEDVSVLSHRYGTIQSQALDPESSVTFIKRLLAGDQ
ncbi:Scr1 family TA system antitoxin-like transcriptional regulator [Streptomyces sp. NPDC005393]|uniref:Scr1 family TA system antitoxin-like transcriptional regulator n=1 Tax=Streptomyces sp. NPDC005393 TaxID=3157041 RepID=UPI0033A01396